MGLCASTPARDTNDDEKGENKVAPVAAELRVKAAMHVKRRVDIFSQGFDPSTTFSAPTYEKSKSARMLIETCLKNHFLFSSLTDDDREMVVKAFELAHLLGAKDDSPFPSDFVSYVSTGDGSVNNAHFLSALNLAEYTRHRGFKCPVVFGE